MRHAPDPIRPDRADLAGLRTRPTMLRHAPRVHFPGEPGGQDAGRGAAVALEWGWPSGLILFSVNLNLDKPIAGNGIIRAAPFPLDLHSLLRRRMTEAGVDARQWTFIHLRQYLKAHRGFLVRWRVRGRVRVAARQAVHRRFRRIHGHVE